MCGLEIYGWNYEFVIIRKSPTLKYICEHACGSKLGTRRESFSISARKTPLKRTICRQFHRSSHFFPPYTNNYNPLQIEGFSTFGGLLRPRSSFEFFFNHVLIRALQLRK